MRRRARARARARGARRTRKQAEHKRGVRTRSCHNGDNGCNQGAAKQRPRRHTERCQGGCARTAAGVTTTRPCASVAVASARALRRTASCTRARCSLLSAASSVSRAASSGGTASSSTSGATNACKASAPTQFSPCASRWRDSARAHRRRPRPPPRRLPPPVRADAPRAVQRSALVRACAAALERTGRTGGGGSESSAGAASPSSPGGNASLRSSTTSPLGVTSHTCMRMQGHTHRMAQSAHAFARLHRCIAHPLFHPCLNLSRLPYACLSQCRACALVSRRSPSAPRSPRASA